MYNFAETIEKIRTMKDIPVRTLVEDIMDPSQYSRFKKNQSHIAADKLFALIDRLNVSFEEFMFIHEKDDDMSFINLQKRLSAAFNAHDIATLHQISTQAQAIFDQTNIPKMRHIAISADLMPARLNQVAFTASQQAEIAELTEYLFQLDMWTHYDIVLFNNNIFAFAPKDRFAFTQAIIKNLGTYKDYIHNRSEYVFFITNLIIGAIANQQVEVAINYIQFLKGIDLDQKMLTEKLIVLFFDGVLAYLQSPDKPLDKCETALTIMDQLELTDFKNGFTNVIDVLTGKVSRRPSTSA